MNVISDELLDPVATATARAISLIFSPKSISVSLSRGRNRVLVRRYYFSQSCTFAR